MARRAESKTSKRAESYRHDDEALLRPDVGTQAQFKKKKPPRTYRYDSSLSPALDWDGQNAARELGETQLAAVQNQLRELHRIISAAGTETPKDFNHPLQCQTEAAYRFSRFRNRLPR